MPEEESNCEKIVLPHREKEVCDKRTFDDEHNLQHIKQPGRIIIK